jgi:hypothetical protein
MSKTKVVPLRIPEHLDELASLSAREEHTDKATALRQWLHKGAALYVLNLVAEGRISKGRAAEVLEVSIYDILNLAQTYGIELGPTDEQIRQSSELLDKLWPRSSA